MVFWRISESDTSPPYQVRGKLFLRDSPGDCETRVTIVKYGNAK
jgi:hypothetical protein